MKRPCSKWGERQELIPEVVLWPPHNTVSTHTHYTPYMHKHTNYCVWIAFLWKNWDGDWILCQGWKRYKMSPIPWGWHGLKMVNSFCRGLLTGWNWYGLMPFLSTPWSMAAPRWQLSHTGTHPTFSHSLNTTPAPMPRGSDGGLSGREGALRGIWVEHQDWPRHGSWRRRGSSVSFTECRTLFCII